MLKYEGLFKRRQNMGEWLYNTFVEGIIPTYIYFLFILLPYARSNFESYLPYPEDEKV